MSYTDPKLSNLNLRIVTFEQLFDEVPQIEKELQQQEPPCRCHEYVPDNPDCPRHAELYRTYQRQLEKRDGSDNSTRASMINAGLL